MIVLKLFSDKNNWGKFQKNIQLSCTHLDSYFQNASGLYVKNTPITIAILDVKKDASLRGDNFNIVFRGILIPFFSKKILLGWIGPSLLYTLLTLLIIFSPLEYIQFRVMALVIWLLVYVTNIHRIMHLRHIIQRALDN